MTNPSKLGRVDRELLSELRNKVERITTGIPEELRPGALERLCDWEELKLTQPMCGGNHAR